MPAGQQKTKPAPIRTNTGASDSSDTHWSFTSPSYSSSATRTSSTGAPSSPPVTQAERSFFGALAQKVRDRSRSRSRSRTPTPAHYASGSPTSTRSHHQMPSSPMSPRPSYSHRHASESSTASSDSGNHAAAANAKRTSTHGSEQSEFERFSYGRHSNDWLFNGFSVKETASKFIQHHRRSSNDRR